MIRITTLSLLFILLQSAIIIRHDIPDERYVEFAESLPVTAAVLKYSQTDLAGTLIAPDWVLSAAHVAEHFSPGDQLVTMDGDSVAIASIVIHQDWYQNGWPEDIALIQLREPLSHLPTVDFYKGDQEKGQIVILIGNGDFGTGLTGPESNDGKIRAATNRVDNATAKYLTWVFDNPESNPEKATELEGISGPGDSSGPALIQVGDTYQIVGVSSGQNTSATGGLEGRYGVTEYYTRVSAYSDWIEKTISN